MKDQSTQLIPITDEDRRFAKFCDMLRNSTAGRIRIEKCIIGATREEVQQLKNQIIELQNSLAANQSQTSSNTEKINMLQDSVRQIMKYLDGTKSIPQKRNKRLVVLFAVTLIAIALAIILPLTLLRSCDGEPNDGDPDDRPIPHELFVFDTKEGGGYIVSGNADSKVDASGELIIPDTYNGQPVVGIKENGFKDFVGIKSVVIPATVTTIGDGAFSGCSKLKDITISEGVKEIGNEAFSDTIPTVLTIPSSVEYIGVRAFGDCNVNKVIFLDREGAVLPDEWQRDWLTADNVKLEYQFHIDLDYNGASSDSLPNKLYVIYNEVFSLPVPIRAGYTFDGWYCGEEQLANTDGQSIGIYSYTKPTLANANWTANINTITFHANGGSGEMEQQRIATDAIVALEENKFIRAGYSFAGWATSVNGAKVYNDGDDYIMGKSSNYSLYAMWTANINTVTFHSNGGSGEMAQQRIATDATVALEENKFIRAGYSFAGWATSVNGAKVYNDGDDYTMGKSSHYSLYAMWTANINTVTFHSNGGSGDMAQQRIATDATVALKENKFIRAGYSFAGWATSVNGAKVYNDGDDYTMGKNSNYFLYATWIANINTITFHANGGSGEMEQQRIATDALKQLSNRTFYKNGCVFAGWSTTSNGDVEYDEHAIYVMGTDTNYDLYAIWEEATPTSNFEIKDIDNNEIEITKYNGTMKDVVLPEYINDRKLTSIGSSAFENNITLTSIIIPKVVTSIGASAFLGCSRLLSVTIPNSILFIGNQAFSNCSGLTNITVESGNEKFHSAGNCLIHTESGTLIAGCKNSQIPNDGSVMSIGEWAFYGCSNLLNITIPNSVTSIGSGAFWNCSSLWSIVINYGVASIGDRAFKGCSSLTSITLPSSVTSIGWRSFVACHSLTSITIPSSVTSIGSYAFYSCSCLTIYCVASNKLDGWDDEWNPTSCPVVWNCKNNDKDSDGYAYATNNGIRYRLYNGEATIIKHPQNSENIIIPSNVSYKGKKYNVTSIGQSAFENCSRLMCVNISNSVTRIGEHAFYGCNSLTSIMIPRFVTSIGNQAFSFCQNLSSIKVEDGNTKYKSAGNCLINITNKNLIIGCKTSVIPADGSVVSIGNFAFFHCNGLTSIKIPSMVTSIGRYAFCDCNMLMNITFDANSKLTNIDEFAFYDCSNLTTVAIPNSVSNIGRNAFYGCSKLSSIVIPSKVTNIGEGVLGSCNSLMSIFVESGNEKYHSAGNCLIDTATKTLIAGCNKSVIPIDGTVTEIGVSAFSGRSNLTSITIPKSVTSIGSNAFDGCDGLIKRENEISYVDKWVVACDVTATSIVLKSNTVGIASAAFIYCKNLTSITIPTSVISIGKDAFYGCRDLASIKYDGRASEWASISKGSYWKDSTGNFQVICSNGTLAKNEA